MKVRAVELSEANAYVSQHHRHHKPVVGHRFSLGAFYKPTMREAWCAATSVDGTFDPSNPSRGQCAVTALVVQDEDGGELRRTTVRGQSHYLNNVRGSIIDLTLEQFGDGASYDAEPVPRERSYLLSSPDTSRRYALLKERVAERMVGVVIVGRPVARMTDQRRTVEVTRLCTDGTKNACSALYAAAARAAAALGYERIQTFILDSEPGTSLRASGWECEGEAGGGQWNHSDEPNLFAGPNRRTDQPTCVKVRWARTLRA